MWNISINELNFKAKHSGLCVFVVPKEMHDLFTCNIMYLLANFEITFPGNKIAVFEMCFFYN